MGWRAEELYFRYPQLTLDQIYSALAYYTDNQEEIEMEIEENLEQENKIFKSYQPPPAIAKLKKQKLKKWQ